MRPSSLSLRTSRLKAWSSRPCCSASSAAFVSGWASMSGEHRFGPGCVAGFVEAVESLGDLVELVVGEVGVLAQRDARVGAGEAQADAVDGVVGVLALQAREQLVAVGRAGAAGVVVSDLFGRDWPVDGGHLDEPDRRAHLRSRPQARSLPAAEGEVDLAGPDRLELHASKDHRPIIRGGLAICVLHAGRRSQDPQHLVDSGLWIHPAQWAIFRLLKRGIRGSARKLEWSSGGLSNPRSVRPEA